MSTPNPLAPQGSLLEQQANGRSTFHVISFIGAVHVMLLCGILWTACSKDEKGKVETPNTLGSLDPYGSPPADNTGGLAPAGNTNASAGPANPSSPGLNPGGGATPGYGATGTASTPVTPPSLPPSAVPTPPPSTANLQESAPATAGSGSEYKVVKGDIGTTIARKNGVSMKSLALANPDIVWSRLKINQVIKIPAASTMAAAPSATAHDASNPANGMLYTVKAGDTGMRIAAKHGLKWAELRRANNLKNDTLHPGQKLTIPHRAGAEGAGVMSPSGVPVTSGSEPTAIPVSRVPGQ